MLSLRCEWKMSADINLSSTSICQILDGRQSRERLAVYRCLILGGLHAHRAFQSMKGLDCKLLSASREKFLVSKSQLAWQLMSVDRLGHAMSAQNHCGWMVAAADVRKEGQGWLIIECSQKQCKCQFPGWQSCWIIAARLEA